MHESTYHRILSHNYRQHQISLRDKGIPFIETHHITPNNLMPLQARSSPPYQKPLAPCEECSPISREDPENSACLVSLRWTQTEYYAFPNAILEVGEPAGGESVWEGGSRVWGRRGGGEATEGPDIGGQSTG